MNILFNASQCGLGNNGGTKTIIRCAETLQELGHDVHIWANINNYTWHKSKIQCLPYLDIGNNPVVADLMDIDWDAFVAVSIWDIEHTLKLKYSQVDNKLWYMRGWEKWYKGEEYLIDQIKKFVAAGGRIIVNSSWLINQLQEKCGVESQLCYSGLDLDQWEFGNQGYDKPYTVGCLVNNKHQTKGDHFLAQLNDYEFDKLIKKDIIFYTFSLDAKGHKNNKDMWYFYMQCDIWLSCSTNEGFHQCPAEAALSGALVIYNDIDSGGTRDYCTPETAKPYRTFDECIEALESPDFSKVEKMQKVLKEKIGSREKNMKRFVELIGG